MDLSQIVSTSIPKALKAVLESTALLFVLLALILRWRSGTFHPVMARIWTIFAGASTIQSIHVKRFVSDESDLAQFRFLTRLRVDTLHNAERVIRWAYQHNVSVHLIKACAGFFDVYKPAPLPTLFSIKPIHVLWRVFLIVALVVVAGVGISGIQYERAIVQMRETKTHVTLSSEYASPLFSEKKFYWSECKKPEATDVFTKRDRELLCGIEVNEKLASSLEATVHEQKAVFLVLLLEAFFFFWVAAFSTARLIAARELKRMLGQQGIHKVDDTQLRSPDGTADGAPTAA